MVKVRGTILSGPEWEMGNGRVAEQGTSSDFSVCLCVCACVCIYLCTEMGLEKSL